MDMTDTLDKMKAAQKVKGDYIMDGLLYCGKCHTQKEVIINVMGQIRKQKCVCRCEQDKIIEERKRIEQKERMEKVQRMKKVGFPDADMEKMTFDMDDHSNEHISKVARRYVEEFDQMKVKGKGLRLYGSVGTGKTFISACIANELIEKGHPCLVTNFARLTNTIMGMYEGKQEYLDSLNQFDLIVIDDLASERDTEFMSEIIQTIIDSRYRSGKPMIVTTNLTPQELKHPADVRKERIYSRLFEMCVPVEVKGKDRRKEKLKQDYKSMEEVLGL